MKTRMIAMLALALTMVLCVGAANVIAAPLSWDGDTNNDWFTATNWNPDAAPAPGDDLTVSSGSPTAGSNVNTNGGGSLLINGGNVQWSGRFNSIGTDPGTGSVTITSGSLTVDYGAGASHAFNVGNGTETGLLDQQGGTVSALNDNDEIKIGNQVAATGTYIISGGILNAGTIINGSGGTGTFHVIGNAGSINTVGYNQSSTSTLELDINGISPIDASGNVSLDGTLDVEFTSTPTVGQTFSIIQYTGNLTGTFASFDNLVDSPLGPDSVELAISYGFGNDDQVQLEVISAVPEPATIGLLIFGCVAILPIIRRRRK